ncbi:hypothetical protein D9M68_358880 [compost metagenome]
MPPVAASGHLARLSVGGLELQVHALNFPHVRAGARFSPPSTVTSAKAIDGKRAALMRMVA